MRDFLHFVKKKIRITIEFMYTYCSHSDITSKKYDVNYIWWISVQLQGLQHSLLF